MQQNVGALAKALRAAGIAGSDIAAEMMAKSMLSTGQKVQKEYEEKKYEVAMWNIGKKKEEKIVVKEIQQERKELDPFKRNVKQEQVIERPNLEEVKVEEPKVEAKPIEQKEIEQIKKIDIDPELEKEVINDETVYKVEEKKAIEQKPQQKSKYELLQDQLKKKAEEERNKLARMPKQNVDLTDIFNFSKK